MSFENPNKGKPINRREFGKNLLAGAAFLVVGNALPAMAGDAPEIGDTYMTEAGDKQRALSAGKAHFDTLKANNPNLKEALSKYELSYGAVGGGPRGQVESS